MVVQCYALAPGDVAIETAIRKLLPRLGLAAISGPALALYTAYELGLLAADAGAAFQRNNKARSFGITLEKYQINTLLVTN